MKCDAGLPVGLPQADHAKPTPRRGRFSVFQAGTNYFFEALTRACATSGKDGPSTALAFVFLRATQRPIGRSALTISSSSAAVPEAGIPLPFVAGTLIEPLLGDFELPELLSRSNASSSSFRFEGTFFAVRSVAAAFELFFGLMAIGVASFVGCKAVVVVGAAAGTPRARLLPMGTVLNTVTGRCVTSSWLTIRTVFTATLRVVQTGTTLATW